jgi:hypothetical protein
VQQTWPPSQLFSVTQAPAGNTFESDLLKTYFFVTDVTIFGVRRVNKAKKALKISKIDG